MNEFWTEFLHWFFTAVFIGWAILNLRETRQWIIAFLDKGQNKRGVGFIPLYYWTALFVCFYMWVNWP